MFQAILTANFVVKRVAERGGRFGRPPVLVVKRGGRRGGRFGCAPFYLPPISATPFDHQKGACCQFLPPLLTTKKGAAQSATLFCHPF